MSVPQCPTLHGDLCGRIDAGALGTLTRRDLAPDFEREIAHCVHDACDRQKYVGPDGCSIKLWEVDGSPQYPLKHTPENIRHFRQPYFTARSDDVWLVSYPRSGTHWTWEIMNMMRTKDFRLTPNYDKENWHLEYHHPAQLQKAPPGGRMLNTHLSHHFFPKDVFEEKCKVVVIMRHPQDVAVSSYYMHLHQGPVYDYHGTWQAYFRLFMDGKVDRGSWFDFSLDWWNHCKDLDHVFFCTYEKLKTDFVGFCQSLASFLEIPITLEEIHSIKNATTIDKMRAHKVTESTPFGGKPAQLIRKGEIGASKAMFTKGQLDELTHAIDEKLGNSTLRKMFRDINTII